MKSNLGLRLGLQYLSQNQNVTDEGFTLTELIITVIIAGIVTSIAVPGWANFVNQQRINVAKDVAFASIRNAQSQAMQTRSNHRASFRTIAVDGEPQIQFAIHPASLTYTDSNTDGIYDTNDSDGIVWENLESGVELDTETAIDSARTSGRTSTIGSSIVYFVEFNFKGFVSGQLGRVVFQGADTNASAQRCIVMSSLIGAMRSDRDKGCDS